MSIVGNVGDASHGMFNEQHHWPFQVPKMEVLSLMFGYFRGGFSLT